MLLLEYSQKTSLELFGQTVSQWLQDLTLPDLLIGICPLMLLLLFIAIVGLVLSLIPMVAGQGNPIRFLTFDSLG